MLKNVFDWCKQHIVIFTIISVVFVVFFGFINIQILHMTSEPEFCHLCHPAQGFGPLADTPPMVTPECPVSTVMVVRA